ncbi:MAG: hypothetical protein U1E78_11715 [Gammaproteobacteria bacterium]
MNRANADILLRHQILSIATLLERSGSVWDRAQAQWLSLNQAKWGVSQKPAIVFDGVTGYLDFGHRPQFYGPRFTMWADVIVGDKTDEQHIYGHFGRDAQDFSCNAQFTWQAASGMLSFRVGAQATYSFDQTGYAPNQRYRLVGRCQDKNIDFWVNGRYLGRRVMGAFMRPASTFGLWAGQREYIRYNSRTPFKGKLNECGFALDTSDTFIQLLNQEKLFRSKRKRRTLVNSKKIIEKAFQLPISFLKRLNQDGFTRFNWLKKAQSEKNLPLSSTQAQVHEVPIQLSWKSPLLSESILNLQNLNPVHAHQSCTYAWLNKVNQHYAIPIYFGNWLNVIADIVIPIEWQGEAANYETEIWWVPEQKSHWLIPANSFNRLKFH